MSHPCNEFIIKDDTFVRDFEGMYQHCNDPWQQRERNETDLLNNAAIFFLEKYIRDKAITVRRILDIGCADGYYAENLLKITTHDHSSYTGTDISPTVIESAQRSKATATEFIDDDIRMHNTLFAGMFDLVFSAKTLYYVAPEIDTALDNIASYLSEKGLLCFTYNQARNAFSNQWLTYEKLRDKLCARSFVEKLFIEIDRFSPEVLVVGIYRKGTS